MKTTLLSFVICLLAYSAHAQQFRQEFGNPRKPFVEAIAVPNHPDSHYSIGQSATLRITAREGGVPLEGHKLYYKVGTEMMLPEEKDSTTFIGGEAIIPMGTMLTPGFLACQYEFQAGGQKQSDLVKVAFNPEDISSFATLPKDFKQFWQKALDEARKVDMQPEVYPVPEATNKEFETRLIRLHVGKQKWMYSYLTIPCDGKKHPVLLTPPGAGSSKIYPDDYFPRHGFIYMKIEIHDNDPRLPDAEYNNMRHQKCEGYMRKGMESKDTYYYKDVYVGCARAIDYLCSLPEWDGRNVIVSGGSQGGALSIVTAALNSKVTLCAPFYPALCDLTGFLHQRAGGWPKFFTNFYSDSQVPIPEEKAVATLQYFDVVNFARQLIVPTFMSWGYSDDTCSPTSIWAAWNEIQAPKQCDITPTSAHWRFQRSQEKCLEWIMQHLK